MSFLNTENFHAEAAVFAKLEITYEATWFLSRRISEVMRPGPILASMSGNGGVAELEETILGRTASECVRQIR